MRWWEPLLIPGLLQTEDYARAVLSDESVLHRRIGAPEVMAMQLEHLLTMGARPNITIQVIPGAAGAYAGLTGAFAVAEVPGESPTAYLETGVSGHHRPGPYAGKQRGTHVR